MRRDRTPEYRAWAAMKSRCSDPNVRCWPDYGGRGITVCDRWKNSFDDFLADIGFRPPGLTLDRRDNNGNYEPGNCKWSTPAEQVANRRPQRKRVDNKSGLAGVRWDAARAKFRVETQLKGQRTFIRTPDFFEACCLAFSARNKITNTINN